MMRIHFKPYLISLFFLFAISLFSAVSAQQRFEGLVLNEEKKPIENATVSLVNGNEVQKVSTDKLGVFRFERTSKDQKIILNVSHLNYEGYEKTIELTGDTMLIINLSALNKILEEVNIKSTKPIFQRKVDRFIFNVANSEITIGNTLWEVLKQTPMLQVTEPAGLAILGSPINATVFINHRKFALSGEDLANFLRSMPAENIIQIEILTIPPPSYDASGPVIDILLKRLDINGLKINSTGTYERASKNRGKLATLLDYNHNRFNQSLMLSYTGGNYFKSIDKTTDFMTVPSTVVSDIDLNTNRKGLNAYTDVSYSLSPVVSVGAQVIYNDYSIRTAADGQEIVNPVNLNSTYIQSIRSENNLINANGYLRYNSSKYNRYFELSTDFLDVRNNQDNNFLSWPGVTGFRTIAPQNIKTYSAKSDYNTPMFDKKFMLNTGLKYSNTTVFTPYEAFDVKYNVFIKNSELSAKFSYQENVISGYATLEKDFGKKWSAKLGFRVENTGIRTESDNPSGGIYHNNYFFIFPTGYLNFVPNQNHSFSLTSKISNSRPDYASLNPARTLVGNRTITEGNPFLQPSNGGIIELMYAYNKSYYFGLTHSRYNRLFTQLNQVFNQDTLLVKWENWGKQQQYNFWFFTSKNLFKEHLNVVFNTNLGYYKRYFDQMTTNSSPMSDNYQLTITLNQTLSNLWDKNLRMALNTSFYTPSRYGLWADTKSSFRLDFVSSYNFPKQNLRLSLMFNDILKYNDRNVYTVNATDLQRTSVLNNNDSRSVRFSVSKSFGNIKTRNLQKRNTSNEDEKTRSQ